MEQKKASRDDQIDELWQREKALLGELHEIGEPLRLAPDIATGLARITRREQATRELEAVRAVKRGLIEQRASEAARAAELEHRRARLCELSEQQLPNARAQDEREGSSSHEERVRERIAYQRAELERLEAGGELLPGTRV